MSDSAGIQARAGAYIEKYAERDEHGIKLKINVSIFSTCVHPLNRAGVYTQGKACKTLLRNIGRDGFSINEVNSNPIVIRERPQKERDDKYVSFLDHNIQKSKLDMLLAGAYAESDLVVFASLAHCHMVQVGRCLHRRIN